MIKLSLLIISLLITTNAYTQISAGAAKRDITPVVGSDEMKDMNFKTVTVEKILDPLHSRVVVFKNGTHSIALVSLDLLVIQQNDFDELRARVIDETGVDSVTCSLTHTHGAPQPSEAHIERIIASTIEATKEALAELEPCEIGHGSGSQAESYNRRHVKEDGTVEMIWTNRERDHYEPVDNELGVVAVRRKSDKGIIATLVNYTAHPTICMNFEELFVSAGYPGALAGKLEERLGGIGLFFYGAGGDINPFAADTFRTGSSEDVSNEIDTLAERLAIETVRVVHEMENFQDDDAVDFQRYEMAFAERKRGPHADKKLTAEVGTLLIGGRLAFVTFAGEPFVELGLDLKRRSPAESTFVLASTNGLVWYFPTIQACTEGGYGASRATRLEVGAGERMVDQAIVSLHYQMGSIKELEE